MRLAIIRKKYSFHGGAEGFSSSFIENLALEGHEIHIFAIQWQTEKLHKNIHFHKVPSLTGISFLREATFAFSTYVLLKRLRGHFDIIQTHDKTLYQDIYRAGDGCHIEWLKQRWKRLGFLGRLSIIMNPYHWLILALERSILKGHRFRKIIAISEMVKKNIINHYDVPPDDMVVIYNGVDLGKFSPDSRKKYRGPIREEYGIGNDDFVVLFVGSGFERKGVRYLIEAVESMSDPVSLMIVGKGKHLPSNPGDTGGAQHKQRILFCGPRKDIDHYYAAADIFVFPSIYEPFGNVHLEALASGLPVITTKNSGGAEIIKDDVHGFVVEAPEDSAAIAQKIKTLIGDKEKLHAMSKNARSLAEEFTFAKHIGKIRSLYESILGGKNSRENTPPSPVL